MYALQTPSLVWQSWTTKMKKWRRRQSGREVAGRGCPTWLRIWYQVSHLASFKFDIVPYALSHMRHIECIWVWMHASPSFSRLHAGHPEPGHGPDHDDVRVGGGQDGLPLARVLLHLLARHRAPRHHPHLGHGLLRQRWVVSNSIGRATCYWHSWTVVQNVLFLSQFHAEMTRFGPPFSCGSSSLLAL